MDVGGRKAKLPLISFFFWDEFYKITENKNNYFCIRLIGLNPIGRLTVRGVNLQMIFTLFIAAGLQCKVCLSILIFLIFQHNANIKCVCTYSVHTHTLCAEAAVWQVEPVAVFSWKQMKERALSTRRKRNPVCTINTSTDWSKLEGRSLQPLVSRSSGLVNEWLFIYSP